MQITIYTDGACDIHADNQPGGWAAILLAIDENGKVIREKVISGGAENTTNNQMELQAVIEGLKSGIATVIYGINPSPIQNTVIDVAS